MKYLLIALAISIYAMGFFSGALVYQSRLPDVTIIEVPVVVASPPIYIEKVVKEIQVIERPIYPEPRQFESTYEYFNWLDNYPFHERKWKAGYDCDDFTVDWWLACAGDGRLAGFATNSAHMQGAVIIDGWIWKAEPQNRTIKKWVPLDRR